MVATRPVGTCDDTADSADDQQAPDFRRTMVCCGHMGRPTRHQAVCPRDTARVRLVNSSRDVSVQMAAIGNFFRNGHMVLVHTV